MEPVIMVTESTNRQHSSEQIPQLPEFSDTEWIDSTMQAISADEIPSSSLLLYV